MKNMKILKKLFIVCCFLTINITCFGYHDQVAINASEQAAELDYDSFDSVKNFGARGLFSTGRGYYVTVNGSGTGSGDNWENSMDNLSFAQALVTSVSGDTFYVAEGEYYPMVDSAGVVKTSTALHTFRLNPGVTIIGSYDITKVSGTLSDFAENSPYRTIRRDTELEPTTVFSADIDKSNTITTSDAYFILIASNTGIGEKNTLNGISFTGGHRGVINFKYVDIEFKYCKIHENRANNGGGVVGGYDLSEGNIIRGENSNLKVNYCDISNNSSVGDVGNGRATIDGTIYLLNSNLDLFNSFLGKNESLGCSGIYMDSDNTSEEIGVIMDEYVVNIHNSTLAENKSNMDNTDGGDYKLSGVIGFENGAKYSLNIINSTIAFNLNGFGVNGFSGIVLPYYYSLGWGGTYYTLGAGKLVIDNSIISSNDGGDIGLLSTTSDGPGMPISKIPYSGVAAFSTSVTNSYSNNLPKYSIIGESYFDSVGEPELIDPGFDMSNFFSSADFYGGYTKTMPFSGSVENVAWGGNHKGNPLYGGFTTDSAVISKGLNRDQRGKLRFSPDASIGAFDYLLETPFAIWKGSAPGDETNWNNPANWDCYEFGQNLSIYGDALPTAYTTVYIPGVASGMLNYPMLEEEVIDNYACKEIYFLPGAELGRQDLLTYEKAHVQLDFGLGSINDRPQLLDNDMFAAAMYPEHNTFEQLKFGVAHTKTTMDRGRWYMMTAPLQEMIAGDLAFGCYPQTYMFKFDKLNAPAPDADPLVGGWTTSFRSYKEPLTLGEGMVFKMNPYNSERKDDMFGESGQDSNPFYLDEGESTRNFGIAEVNGILEFPYFQDPLMMRARRTQKLVAPNTAQYNYVRDTKTSTDYMEILSTRYDLSNKTDSAYRFITTGNYSYALGNKAGGAGFAGNSYMSSIDFWQLYNDNAGKINPWYRYFDGDIFVTVGFDANGNPDTESEGDRYIAPMQAFLVDGVSENTTLNFNISSLSVARPASEVKFKSAPAISNRANEIRIIASNSEASSIARIKKRPDAQDTYEGSEDVYKLFTPYPDAPEVYTYSDGYAIEKNHISSDDITIPVGFKTAWKGTTVFTFKGMDQFDGKVEFIDTHEKTGYYELSDSEIFEYTFENTQAGVQQDRFYLRLSAKSPEETNSTQENAAHDISIYSNANGIYILASPDNLINSVEIYNVHGQLMYFKNQIKSLYHTVGAVLESNQVYVIKVVSDKVGSTTVKLIK